MIKSKFFLLVIGVSIFFTSCRKDDLSSDGQNKIFNAHQILNHLKSSPSSIEGFSSYDKDYHALFGVQSNSILYDSDNIYTTPVSSARLQDDDLELEEGGDLILDSDTIKYFSSLKGYGEPYNNGDFNGGWHQFKWYDNDSTHIIYQNDSILFPLHFTNVSKLDTIQEGDTISWDGDMDFNTVYVSITSGYDK